jgi:hypothetical protein
VIEPHAEENLSVSISRPLYAQKRPSERGDTFLDFWTVFASKKYHHSLKFKGLPAAFQADDEAAGMRRRCSEPF